MQAIELSIAIIIEGKKGQDNDLENDNCRIVKDSGTNVLRINREFIYGLLAVIFALKTVFEIFSREKDFRSTDVPKSLIASSIKVSSK